MYSNLHQIGEFREIVIRRARLHDDTSNLTPTLWVATMLSPLSHLTLLIAFLIVGFGAFVPQVRKSTQLSL